QDRLARLVSLARLVQRVRQVPLDLPGPQDRLAQPVSQDRQARPVQRVPPVLPVSPQAFFSLLCSQAVGVYAQVATRRVSSRQPRHVVTYSFHEMSALAEV